MQLQIYCVCVRGRVRGGGGMESSSFYYVLLFPNLYRQGLIEKVFVFVLGMYIVYMFPYYYELSEKTEFFFQSY